MARKITGHIEWRGGQWKVQATGPDGARDWYPLSPNIRQDQEELARAHGQVVAQGVRRGDLVPTERDETGSEWFKRYHEAAETGNVGRKNRGKPQATVEDRRSRFKTWIEPHIGHLPMRAIGAAELRRVVQALDDQIRIRMAFYEEREGVTDERKGKKPGLSPKSAANIWTEVTSGFKEACSSKIDELRVRADGDNPAIGVQPPNGGDDREQAALFPSEVIQLLSCALIPITRRYVYAVAIYGGMRRSELARLTAVDVDLEHNQMRVRGTKTDAARRRTPIEPALRPLIEALIACTECHGEGASCETCAGTGKRTGVLLSVPRADGKGGASDLVKKDLERAGLTRPELFQDDAHHMPFTFHGMRHTAVTHAYVAGRDETWLKSVYGHTTSEMSRRYLDAAAVGRATFGTPFPPLPKELLDASVSIAQESPNRPKKEPGNLTFPGELATPAGIEPALPA